MKHRHGATAATAMAHVAIVEAQGGKSCTWMEKITGEQYGGKSPAV